MPCKVMFVIISLSGGGAERSLLVLLNHLDRNKFSPLLVLFEDIVAYKKEVPLDVKVICLGKKNRYDVFKLIISLAKTIKQEKPALIVPIMPYPGFLTLAARRLARNNLPVVISQRNNPSVDFQHENFPFLKAWLARRLYPQADMIHCNSHGIKAGLVHDFGIPSEKIRVIFNPYDLERIKAMAPEEAEHPWFQGDIPVLLACGRLTFQKNYPFLFRAMRQVLDKTQARLVVLGEGEERQQLEKYARELRISHNVAFLGFEPNPFKFMARATALVLSSAYEGFPRVIVEAMACGLPVISTRCPFGPEEIITHGVNGLLVPMNQEDRLSGAILEVLGNESLRKRFADAGKRRAEDFRLENILPQFEEMFASMC